MAGYWSRLMLRARPKGWATTHQLAIAVAFMALVFALTVIFPRVLTDAAATLLGAGGGAAIAVYGARIAAESVDIKYSVDLVNAAQETTSLLMQSAEDFGRTIQRMDGRSETLNEPSIVRLQGIIQAARTANEELELLKPAFDRKPEFLMAYVGLGRAIRKVAVALENFAREDQVRRDYKEAVDRYTLAGNGVIWHGPIPNRVSAGEFGLCCNDLKWARQRIFNLV